MDASILAVVTQFLQSSSSSSSSSFGLTDSDSDSDEDLYELINFFKRNERHSSSYFVEDVVAKYTDDEFRRHFRMSRQTASILSKQFENSKYYRQKNKNGGRKSATAEVQCLSFLWFAGNKYTARQVSKVFNTPLSNAYRFQTMFLEFLSEIASHHIKMPVTKSEKDEKCKEFAKIARLDNVLGCIKGCFIQSRYEFRLKRISQTMEAICDANKKFLAVSVGSTSSSYDSQIFKDVPKICGNKYYLLGDAVYPLREYLLTPYKDCGDLTMQEKKFNEKHKQTMGTVENAFGLLNQRFRQLTRLDFCTPLRMSKFVLGCCVLHNFCIDNGDLWHDENDTNAETSEVHKDKEILEIEEVSHIDTVLLQKGQLKRDGIAQKL